MTHLRTILWYWIMQTKKDLKILSHPSHWHSELLTEFMTLLRRHDCVNQTKTTSVTWYLAEHSKMGYSTRHIYLFLAIIIIGLLRVAPSSRMSSRRMGLRSIQTELLIAWLDQMVECLFGAREINDAGELFSGTARLFSLCHHQLYWDRAVMVAYDFE